MSICHKKAANKTKAIDTVQNVYDVLSFSDEALRDGSEWVRGSSSDLELLQDFADFYGASVSQVLGFSDQSVGNKVSPQSASHALELSHANTIAGGRLDTPQSSFQVVYHTGGPSAVEGLWVYVDPDDAEAKLATSQDSQEKAEVAAVLSENASSGQTVNVTSEGALVMLDWTNIAGTALLSPGVFYYLTTAGQMSTQAPVTGKVVILGRAITATEFDIEINPPWSL